MTSNAMKAIKAMKAMEKALEKLQSGAIVLNLDDEEPVSRKDCAVLFLSGGLNSGHNRWFDKSINLMICAISLYLILREEECYI